MYFEGFDSKIGSMYSLCEASGQESRALPHTVKPDPGRSGNRCQGVQQQITWHGFGGIDTPDINEQACDATVLAPVPFLNWAVDVAMAAAHGDPCAIVGTRAAPGLHLSADGAASPAAGISP